MVLGYCEGDAGGFTQDGDFEEARVDGVREVGYLFELPSWSSLASSFLRIATLARNAQYQIVGLPDFIGRLLQPSLRSINPSIALVDVLLHVPHIIPLKPQFSFLRRIFSIVFRLERLAMDLWTLTQVLLRICEEVVWTCSDEVRSTDLRI